MIANVLAAAAEEAHEHVELPMPALAYGLTAFGILFALLLVTFAFRSVSTRH